LRLAREILPRGLARKMVMKVMIPKPPNWMRSMMTSLPKPEYREVSTDVSPVTQTAEVEVNSASTYASLCGPRQAGGSHRRKLPRRMMVMKYVKRKKRSLLRIRMHAGHLANSSAY
jgi:hypothetical protein